MKTLILSFSLAFLGSAAFAQHEGHDHSAHATETKAVAAAPVEHTLKLVEETYDFGKIPQGKPVTHIFEVQNTGNKPLKLVNVQASCGCTTPEWEKDKDIAPGETSNIKVGYNAAAEGPFNKMITITYGENLTKQFTIKGEVWKTPAASAPANEAANELKD